MDCPCVHADGSHLLFLRIYESDSLVVWAGRPPGGATVSLLSGRRLFPYRKPEKVFFKILCIAVPMGLLHFFMRFGNVFVRPDGFYPQNAMLSSFLILIVCFQAFEWIGSRRLRKAAAGCGVLLALLAWPFVAGILSGTTPIVATAVGILGYTLLPVINISGDVTIPVLMTGIVLYLTHRNRKIQAAALAAVNFAWHFILVYLQVRTWPGFTLSQMFTVYYEWMGAVFAVPFLLCYNGRREPDMENSFMSFIRLISTSCMRYPGFLWRRPETKETIHGEYYSS